MRWQGAAAAAAVALVAWGAAAWGPTGSTSGHEPDCEHTFARVAGNHLRMPPMGTEPADCPPVDPDRDGFSGAPFAVRAAAAGLGAGGLALVAFSLRRFWWPAARTAWAGGVGLFARLTRQDVAAHPLRARILEFVRVRPAPSVAELADRLEANPGTLEYHLLILQKAGHVRLVKAGRNRLVVPAGAGLDAEALAALAADGRAEVARTVLSGPGVHAAAIATQLGLARATVHHHLERLEAAGLVRVERGLRARCFPTDRLRSLFGATPLASAPFDQDDRNA